MTQIKGNFMNGASAAQTEAIRADARIPITGSHITVADLPVFAEWQRKVQVSA